MKLNLKNLKIKVNNEQRKIVQKIAYHYGCTLCNDDSKEQNEVSKLDERVLFKSDKEWYEAKNKKVFYY